jgi:hypothetical protein
MLYRRRHTRLTAAHGSEANRRPLFALAPRPWTPSGSGVEARAFGSLKGSHVLR